GLLADLGVSSHQFDIPERGFSIRFDAALDMRMNVNANTTARHIINKYDEHRLHQLFSNYGEIINARKLARTIVEKRADKPINTVEDLKQAVKMLVPPAKENQYLAQLFQALRIEVNEELEALKEMLLQCEEVI